MRLFFSEPRPQTSDIKLSPDLLVPAFERSAEWSAGLLSPFFGHCDSPRTAATKHLQRQVRAGWLRAAKLDVAAIPFVDGSLATSDDSTPPDYERLSYFALQRLSSSPQPTTVYWPSAAFARLHGRWTGSDRAPNPLQISHSLLCSTVWLRHLQLSPELALRDWISEREIHFRARQQGSTGPIPDALIERDGRTTAIEVLGKYPANWIRHHVEQFETTFDAWELW